MPFSETIPRVASPTTQATFSFFSTASKIVPA
jgi:hypothetical protein